MHESIHELLEQRKIAKEKYAIMCEDLAQLDRQINELTKTLTRETTIENEHQTAVSFSVVNVTTTPALHITSRDCDGEMFCKHTLSREQFIILFDCFRDAAELILGSGGDVTVSTTDFQNMAKPLIEFMKAQESYTSDASALGGIKHTCTVPVFNHKPGQLIVTEDNNSVTGHVCFDSLNGETFEATFDQTGSFLALEIDTY